MTIFVWDPITNFVRGTNSHIATQGFDPTRHPLTVGSQGFVLPVYAEIHIVTGGSAGYFYDPAEGYIADGSIYVDGAGSPSIFINAGVGQFNYTAAGGLVSGSAAPFIITADGELTYDYPVDPSIKTLSGTVIPGVELSKEGEGGITINGEGDIVWDPVHPPRGGKALANRTRVRLFQTPHHYIWFAPTHRSLALKLKGSADAEFIESPDTPVQVPLDEVSINEYIDLFGNRDDIRDEYVPKKTALPAPNFIDYSEPMVSQYLAENEKQYPHKESKQYSAIALTPHYVNEGQHAQYEIKNKVIYENGSNEKQYPKVSLKYDENQYGSKKTPKMY